MSQTHTDLDLNCKMIYDEEQPSFCSIQSVSDYSDDEVETKTTSNSDIVSVVTNSCWPEAKNEDEPSPRLGSYNSVSPAKPGIKSESFHLHDLSRAETESPGKFTPRASRIPLPVTKLFSSSPRPLLKRKSVSLMDVSKIEPFTELNPVLSWDTIVSEGSHEKSKDSGYNCSTSMFSINSSKISKHDEELNYLNDCLKKELEYREVMINTLQESNMELRMKCAEAENKIVELRLKCQKVNSCCCSKKQESEEKSKGLFPSPHVSSSSNESSLSEVTVEPSSVPSQSLSRPSSSSTDKAAEKKYPKEHRSRPSYKSTVVDCNLIKNPIQHSRSQGFGDKDLQKHLAIKWQERHPNMKLESVFKTLNNSDNCNTHRILNGSGDRSTSRAERLIANMFKEMNAGKQESKEKALCREGQFRPWLHPKDSEGEKSPYGIGKQKDLDVVKSNSSVDISWDNSSDSSSRFKRPDKVEDSVRPNTSEMVSVRSPERNYILNKSGASRSVGTMVHPGGSPIVDKYFSMMDTHNRADFFKVERKRNEEISEKVITMQKDGETNFLSSFLPRQTNKDISLRQWTELILKDKESNISNLTQLTVSRKESHAEQLTRWSELKDRLSHLKIPSSSQGTPTASRSELPVTVPVSSQLVSSTTLPISSSIGSAVQLPVSRFLSPVQMAPADSSLNFFSDSSQNSSPKSAVTLQEVLEKAEKYAKELSDGLAAIPPKLRDIQSIGH